MIFYSHYKKIRRERKIALEDISKRTKIDIKYLKSLESGKFAEIPGIYTKLFFRAYINEIGCDIDEALDSLENFLNKKDNKNTYKDEDLNEDKSLFNIRFSHLQRSNILVGIIFLSLVFATILLQDKPSSSEEDKKALLRLTEKDIESIYAINSKESFSEDLQTPINIRFNSLNENYIKFSDNSNISSEYFIFEGDSQSNLISEEWNGKDIDITIANTREVELILFSQSEFSQMLDLSDRISNNFPVLITLRYDPLIISITKYIPKR